MLTMTDVSPSKSEEGDVSAYFILDETGDTSADCGLRIIHPVNEKESGEESEDSEEVESEIEPSEGISNQSSSSNSPMGPRRLVPRSAIGDGTPGSTRRRGSKRKRRQTMTIPVIPNKKPSPGKVTKRNRKNKKKKKSVIVIDDSDSEREETSPGLPDISVVEIDDSQSIIVLSDDEVGVCSGSVTKNQTKKPSNPPSKPFDGIQANSNRPQTSARQTSPTKAQASPTKPAPLFVEDLTGNYIMKENPKETSLPKNFELYQPLADQSKKKTGLRPIVIDGCNVAFGHGRDRFSSLGLKICVDYFKKMGHEVRAFVPQFRKTHSATTDPQILVAMEKEGTLSFTPSRRTDGKMIVSYDDRFIVQYADANGGVIVSRDNYRDLLNENPEWKETIHKRLLMFTWVGDTIMFPKDPLGRGGPNLEDFLKF